MLKSFINCNVYIKRWCCDDVDEDEDRDWNENTLVFIFIFQDVRKD